MNKKIIAFVLATALLAGVIAPAVGAEEEVTIESLQKVIAELVATIASLRSQLEGQTTPVATGLCLTSDLSQGMTSAEVKILQQGLNQNVATQVAAAGAGAAGTETTYFGPLTRTAVVKFQELYAAEVLTPGGLARGTGFAGPATRAKFNALFCSPVTPPTTVPGEEEAPPAYGSLNVVKHPVSNPVSEVYGGQTYELVAGQYKATGSDMTIKKVAVKTVSDSIDVLPWNAFSSISLWDGETKLAELPVSEANSTKITFAKEYIFDISGLNWKIAKDEQKVLTVKATVVPSVGSTAKDRLFTFYVLANGTISQDTAKVTYTLVTGGDVDSQKVTIKDTKLTDFNITAATDNPKAGNVTGSKTSTTEITVLKFNVKNNTNIAANFNSGFVTATSTFATTTVSLKLYDGDTLLASASPNATGTATWTNFVLPIAGNTTKILTVKAVIAQLPDNFVAGSDNVKVNVGPGLSGLDANGNIASISNLSVVGNAQTIYLNNPTFELASASAISKDSSTSTKNDAGEFTIGIKITALGGDIYIPTAFHATYGAAEIGAEGIMPTITKTAGTETATSSFWSCDSEADEDGANKVWKISEGFSSICTYTYSNVNTSAKGWYEVSIKQIKWATDPDMVTGYVTQTDGLSALKTKAIELSK